MRTLRAVVPALALVAAVGVAGCGAVHHGRAGAREPVRLISSGRSPGEGKITLNAGARRFMEKVPVGDTGYPSIGLVLAPAAAHRVVTRTRTTQVLRLFYKLRSAQAVLGAQLKSPQVSYSIITDYSPLFRDMKRGGKFPAVVLTYHHVTCESYGPPGVHGSRHPKCTTVAFYDLKNSRWLGIFQYTARYPGAFKKT